MAVLIYYKLYYQIIVLHTIPEKNLNQILLNGYVGAPIPDALSLVLQTGKYRVGDAKRV